MRELEEETARDQVALRSVTEDVGRCPALLAVSTPQGTFLELGSSCGYSSLWLSLAARTRGVTLITVELNERKIALVRENIACAGVAASVQAVHGDALDYCRRV
jgi:predicted O-methyltransferase YrrM